MQYHQSHIAHLNDNSTMLEISAGVGGQEAMLFAGELFNMYEAFSLSQGWEVEIIDVLKSELGKLKASSLFFTTHVHNLLSNVCFLFDRWN